MKSFKVMFSDGWDEVEFETEGFNEAHATCNGFDILKGMFMFSGRFKIVRCWEI